MCMCCASMRTPHVYIMCVSVACTPLRRVRWTFGTHSICNICICVYIHICYNTQNFGTVFSIPALVVVGMKLLAQLLLGLQTWWAQYRLQKAKANPDPNPTPNQVGAVPAAEG